MSYLRCLPNNFLQPALIGDLVKSVKGTIVECNTAYGGGRAKTEDQPAAAKCKTKEIIQIFFIMAICVLRTL